MSRNVVLLSLAIACIGLLSALALTPDRSNNDVSGIRVIGSALEEQRDDGASGSRERADNGMVPAENDNGAPPSGRPQPTDEMILMSVHEIAPVLKAFNEQPIDREWSDRAQRSARKALETVPYLRFGADYSAECKSSFCRIGISPVEYLTVANRNIYMGILQGTQFAEKLTSESLAPKVISFTSNGRADRVVIILERRKP